MKYILVLLLSLTSCTALDRPRGVSIEKASFYQGGTEFRCLGNGKTIPFDHVNDDYCDCEDGSDEPGTAACSNGLFFCENKSFKGSYIISSRVNDGICDCCDGSDEYDGSISCENTCEKVFAAIRAQQEAFREKQDAGYKIKLEYIQNGRRLKDEKLARLTELSKDKEFLVSERDTLQAAKEVAEAPEKEAKTKHEQAWEAVKAERKKKLEAEAASVAFAELDANKDSIVDFPEITRHPEFDIDSDGTVSDEEAKEYLEEAEQVDLTTFIEKIWPNIKEIYKPFGTKSEEPPADKVEPPLPEDPADPLNDKVSEEDKMPDYDDETKKLIAIADEARKKYDEAENKVKDIDHEINEIKKYLELDLGIEEEFSALKGQCFEYTDREYTYKFCPYEKTSQKPKGGGIETNLGNWGHWHGPEGDKYDSMKYENGQNCWNGPNRSCNVKLHCGAENALTGASEPSRCEYQFEFTTPARCSAPPPPGSHSYHEEL